VQSAYSLLTNWKQNSGRPNTNVNEGIAFATSDKKEGAKEITFATNGEKGKADKSKITCHRCKKLGHYANECPENENLSSSGNRNTTM
jgi:Zinc knuckle